MKLPLERHSVEGLFNIDSENNSLEVCMDYDVTELEKMYEEIKKKYDETLKKLKDREDTSVGWSVNDFISRAWEKEFPDIEPENIAYDSIDFNEIAKQLKVYDPDKFRDALERMIYRHDATIGITWDTIDYYLDEYCLKDKKHG